MNCAPAAQIIPFGCCGAFFSESYDWFFVSGPAIIKNFMDNWPIPRFWLLASRPRILPPKPEVLKYPANYVRVLNQAGDPHLRAALRAGQGIISSFDLISKPNKAGENKELTEIGKVSTDDLFQIQERVIYKMVETF